MHTQHHGVAGRRRKTYAPPSTGLNSVHCVYCKQGAATVSVSGILRVSGSSAPSGQQAPPQHAQAARRPPQLTHHSGSRRRAARRRRGGQSAVTATGDGGR